MHGGKKFSRHLASQVDGSGHRSNEAHGARQLLWGLQEVSCSGSEGLEGDHDALPPPLGLGRPLGLQLARLHILVLALLFIRRVFVAVVASRNDSTCALAYILISGHTHTLTNVLSSRHNSPVGSSPPRRCALGQLQSRVHTLPSAPQSATHGLTELPRRAAEPLPAYTQRVVSAFRMAQNQSTRWGKRACILTSSVLRWRAL